MKCAVHPDADATGYCRNCGKALCPACTRNVQGMVYCETCLAAMISQPVTAEGHGPRPALAAMLGAVPGLGAVYNAQYMKAVIHVGVFALIVTILSTTNSTGVATFFGIGLGGYIVYMMVDAYRTAMARQSGQMPPELPAVTPMGKAIGPFILIGIGIVFLLVNFGWLDFDRLIDVWWPVILIAAGGLLAWRHMAQQNN
jgi:Domain of unknown function (DUF5668)/B-box zinc finger